MSKEINKDILGSQIKSGEQLNHLVNRVVTTLKFIAQCNDSLFNNPNYTPYRDQMRTNSSNPRQVIFKQVEKLASSSEPFLQSKHETSYRKIR